MSELTDIRWEQRFVNFERALSRLGQAMENGPSVLSELEQEGAIQRFEYTYELAWKTIKDFPQFSGITINPISPRQVLKASFAAKFIESQEVWIDMLNHRNLVAHDYDEQEFPEALKAVHERYLPELIDLKNRLKINIRDAN